MQFLPLFTAMISLYLIPISTPEKLLFAMTHFRHGARAPNSIDSQSLDKTKEKWTTPGELTAVGMRMQYLLGLRNRKRYIEDYKLLSPIYDPHEIFVYSTRFNRTLMSVYSQLQGLYPHKEEIGAVLSEEQEISAVPQVDISDSYIQDEIELMNNSALPNFMTAVPVRMISSNDKLLNVRCSGNHEVYNTSMDSVIAVRYYFNEKYKKYLNTLFGNNTTSYDFSSITSFCDSFVASYTDRREMTELKNTGVNFEELVESCYEVQKIYFRDYTLNAGDTNSDKVESSKLFQHMIQLMKQRVDDDINQVTTVDNTDFSRPKMMLVSAHDTTVSANEIAVMNCFNLDLDDFRLPKFTAQIAFEVTRKDDSEISDISKLTYSNYTVSYYFNDEKLLSTSLDYFIEKMDDYLWTDEEIDNYCSDNSSSSNNTDTDDDSEDSNMLVYGIVIITLWVLLVVFLIGNIILIVLYRRAKSGGSDKSVSLIGVSKSNV